MYDLKETTDRIGSSMRKRIDDFYSFVFESGLLGLWRRSYYQFHSGYFNGGTIHEVGKDGELLEISVNDYRNILSHLAILITSSDIKWDVRSINTDKKSQLQSMLIPGLLEYYEKYGGARREAYRAAEYALEYGSGYLYVEWDKMSGEVFDVKDVGGTDFSGNPIRIKKPEMTGDVKFRSIGPIDVIFDYSQKEYSRNKWVIIREFKSKYELADLYKEHKEEIEGLSYEYDFQRDLDEYSIFWKTGDYVPVYTLWHEQTPSMPYGRKTVMLSNDLIVEDDILRYDRIPLAQMTAGFIDRTAFGYTMGFDLLSLQRARDILWSAIITNQSMFGVQNVAIVEGTSIEKDALEGGMNLVKYPPGSNPPIPLNLTQTPPEIPKMIEAMGGEMQLISGVTSVTRGQPDPRITAGNAMAMIQAQTIQFSSNLQASYVDMREQAALICLEIIKNSLTTKKSIAISGKLPGQYINSFMAEDLEGISRVILDQGNPATKTAMGRRAMADNLLQYGAIKDPEKYIQIATTGNVEVGTEDKFFEGILIKDHEEKLLRGEMPIISWTDNHQRFIQMAVNLLNTPHVRDNGASVELITAYIDDHIQQSISADPVRMAAIGRPPLIPPAPEGEPMGPPPGSNGPAQGEAKAAEEMAAPRPGIPPGQNLPTNPMTKQEWNPQDGGQGEPNA